MRVALVSDVHLKGLEDPNQARFVAWLGSLDVDRLCLCGDVFHHWWHFGAAPFPAYAPVVDALRRFDLRVLPGNHDFKAPSFFGVAAPTLRETWDGVRVHLEHGDQVDLSAGYRAVSAVLRGRPFATFVNALGADRAWPFLARLSGSGRVRENRALIDAQVDRARSLCREGVDIVVSGHTHAPGVHALNPRTYVNLGDWVTHGTYGWFEDGTIELRTLQRDSP